MNSEFIEIQTDRGGWIIYLLSRYDIHIYVFFAYVSFFFVFFSSKNPFNFLEVVVVVVGEVGALYIRRPRGEGFNDFRWNPTEEEDWGGVGKKTQFWRASPKCMVPQHNEITL